MCVLILSIVASYPYICSTHVSVRLVPSENVANISASATVLEGVSRSRNALLNGNTRDYDWESGYTCHQLGSGCIVVQLAQPYIISSMRYIHVELCSLHVDVVVTSSCTLRPYQLYNCCQEESISLGTNQLSVPRRVQQIGFSWVLKPTCLLTWNHTSLALATYSCVIISIIVYNNIHGFLLYWKLMHT